MFHLAAFFANADNAALAEVAAVPDNVLTIESSRFALRRDYRLLFAQAIATTITRARLVSPSLRQITPPDLIPYVVAAQPGDLPPIADYTDYPFLLRGGEDLSVETVNSGAAAIDHFVTIGLTDQPISRPNGQPIYTLRGTSTSTLVAAAWSEVAVTWDDRLPVGDYQVVGLRGESAGLIAARLRFEGQLLRPGVPGVAAAGLSQWPKSRRGGLGVFGRFNSLQMPTPEFLSLSADTAETIYLDIQRV